MKFKKLMGDYWIGTVTKFGTIEIGKNRVHFPYGVKDVYPKDFSEFIEVMQTVFAKQREFSFDAKQDEGNV